MKKIKSVSGYLSEERLRLLTEVEQLKAELRYYGEHMIDCPRLGDKKCECGFRDVWFKYDLDKVKIDPR